MRYHACFFVFYLSFCRVMLEDDSTGASTQCVSRLHLSIPRPPCYVLDVNEHRDISAKWIQVICFLCLTRRREKRSRDVGGCAASQNETTKRFHCLVYTSEIAFPDSYLNETILTKKALVRNGKNEKQYNWHNSFLRTWYRCTMWMDSSLRKTLGYIPWLKGWIVLLWEKFWIECR